ncbi:ABC transporter ATP-binding protein, partial [Candidatus Izimaplasma bacterium]|nr:ABC transporter ATP-binding protein [Candidatus Izimaplasma bacterium]
TTKALDKASLRFRPGEFVAILGPSGCGKTTMLNIIGGLDRYTSGDLLINGRSTKDFKESDWDAYRNNSVGFVFQSYNLINHISILENVEMGMTLSGVSVKERKAKATEVLTQVGLGDQIHKRSSQLSGGQKQRAAIARALVNDPDVILADEPTGALDTKTSKEVMELIREIAKEKLVIMVTHNREIAELYATRLVSLRDGQVLEASEPDELHDEDDKYNAVKTSMSFLTALKLSFNNLRTKFGRTLLTAFAGSIGIIGVALVLAISNGFNGQLSTLETETLSTLPITISETPMFNFRGGPPGFVDNEEGEQSDTTEFDPVYESESEAHYNVIDQIYVDYINNIDQELVSSIQYNYGVSLLMMTKQDNVIQTSNASNVNFGEFSNNDSYIEGQYNLVAGALPSDESGVVIIVDQFNKIDGNVLEFLGFDPDVAIVGPALNAPSKNARTIPLIPDLSPISLIIVSLGTQTSNRPIRRKIGGTMINILNI